MRYGKIVYLQWQNVDLTRKIIKVEKTKSQKARFVPINSFLFGVLDRLKRGNEKATSEFPFRYVSEGFRNARRRAKVDNFVFHDLRRTFGTRLLENGVDIVTISKLYGHSSVLVTQRYLHPADRLSKEAVEQLVDGSEKLGERAETLAQDCHTDKDESQKYRPTSVISMN